MTSFDLFNNEALDSYSVEKISENPRKLSLSQFFF